MPRTPGPGPPPDIKPYRPHPIGGGLLAKKCCCAPGGGGDCPTWAVPPCAEYMRIIHTQFKAMSPAHDYPEFYCIHEVAFMIRAHFDPNARIYRGINDSNDIVYFTDHVQRFIDGELEGDFSLEYPHVRFAYGELLELRCDHHEGDPSPYNMVRYKASCDWSAMYCEHAFGGRWWQADPVLPSDLCVRAGKYTDFEPWIDPDVEILNPGNMIILDPA